MLLSPETETVARKALVGEALWKVLKKIDQHYDFKMEFSLIPPKINDRVELIEITHKSITLETQKYSFELICNQPDDIARLLVREYNVYSCIENIKNPDSQLL